MNNKILQEQDIRDFHVYLVSEEKSTATVDKYLRDSRAFLVFAGQAAITKELVMAYKEALIEKNYALRSINSMLASLNSLLNFLGCGECKVKSLRSQRQIYCPEDRELTKEEYMRLLNAARHQPQLRLVMETICSTGIRVSELQHFTVEAVGRGEIVVCSKGKTRRILIPGKLKRLLLEFAKKNNIRTGAIFITKRGNALNRSNIWAKMKIGRAHV